MKKITTDENEHDEFLELLDSILEIITEWKKYHEEAKGDLQ